MLHNVTEFEIRDGLFASYDLKTGGKNIIFRIQRRDGEKWKLLAASNISEHECFGVQECYTEATLPTEDITIEDFRVLFEHLKYHIAWFRRTFEGPLKPFIVDQTYFKNKYGTRAKLMQRARKLNEYKR